MRTFESIDELAALVGQEVAVSEWVTVSQQQIDLFAEATGDHQWIHVDEERAKAGPFGSTIAHGFLTLSLLPRFFETALDLRGSRMGINYGLNRVRFTGPVPAGSRLHATLKLLDCQPVADDGRQLTWQVTVHREGVAKPVCVAESLTRRYP
jgi:acyl dehydratase